MRLYLVRHGVAEERAGWFDDDDLRPLTEKGAEGVARVAAALARAGVAPKIIITSPLSRAEQTARILADALGAPVVVDERAGGGLRARDLAAMCGAAGADGHDVMIVGHEPDMGIVLRELTGARVTCKKGACARVDFEKLTDAGGTLVWLLTPALADG